MHRRSCSPFFATHFFLPLTFDRNRIRSRRRSEQGRAHGDDEDRDHRDPCQGPNYRRCVFCNDEKKTGVSVITPPGLREDLILSGWRFISSVIAHGVFRCCQRRLDTYFQRNHETVRYKRFATEVSPRTGFWLRPSKKQVSSPPANCPDSTRKTSNLRPPDAFAVGAGLPELQRRRGRVGSEKQIQPI